MLINRESLMNMRKNPILYYLNRELSLFGKKDLLNAKRRSRASAILLYLRRERLRRVVK